jgi:transaldolase
MQIWLESVDIPLILKAKGMGILYGVSTSNPVPKEVIQELLKAQKGFVAVEIKAADAPSMVAQAKELRQLSDKILVKVPTTRVGLEVIYSLSGEVPTIATGIFDFNQALLGAKGGASYISPDYSWICEADMAGIHTIRAMLEFIKRYGLSSQMLASTLRSPEQVKELADMGAHAIELNEKVFKGLIEDNPHTQRASKIGR